MLYQNLLCVTTIQKWVSSCIFVTPSTESALHYFKGINILKTVYPVQFNIGNYYNHYLNNLN